MELLFIRHALPIRREVTEGAADPPLSDIGRQQAQLLTEYLASEHIDAIYASPLKRAVETAKPLSEHHGKPSVLDAGLAEFDQHSSEYIPVEEMKAKVVEAEAEVPLALAEAFRSGNLGVMDYYRLNNIKADTDMRDSISKEGEE